MVEIDGDVVSVFSTMKKSFQKLLLNSTVYKKTIYLQTGTNHSAFSYAETLVWIPTGLLVIYSGENVTRVFFSARLKGSHPIKAIQSKNSVRIESPENCVLPCYMSTETFVPHRIFMMGWSGLQNCAIQAIEQTCIQDNSWKLILPLVGNSSNDDAAAYDLGKRIGFYLNYWFFMPIVDDVRLWACIVRLMLSVTSAMGQTITGYCNILMARE